MDKICICGLECYAHHGATDSEQAVGHRYLFDLSLEFDTSKAGVSDNLADTIDYSAVAAKVLSIATNTQFRLLEALAHHITQTLLSEFPINAVELTVSKPMPPFNAIARSVGITVFRRRSSG